MKANQTLDTPYVFLEIKEGIVSGFYKTDLMIDLLVAKQVVQQRKEFFNNNDYPVMIFDNGVRGMNKEARDYFSSAEGSAGIKAAALILKFSFSKMFGNFLLKINKPIIPVKIFNDEKKARIWLQQFL